MSYWFISETSQAEAAPGKLRRSLSSTFAAPWWRWTSKVLHAAPTAPAQWRAASVTPQPPLPWSTVSHCNIKTKKHWSFWILYYSCAQGGGVGIVTGTESQHVKSEMTRGHNLAGVWQEDDLIRVLGHELGVQLSWRILLQQLWHPKGISSIVNIFTYT